MQMFRCVVMISIGAAIPLTRVGAALAQSTPSPANPASSSTPATTQPNSSLDPDPNPLQLPTKPDEIRLQGTQPITLQAAIALAERNNRDLQVAELTLRRSHAALRQARAALYPTLAGDTEIGYERNSRDRLDDLKYLVEDASPTGILSGKVEINYELFTFGRRPARIRAAQAQVQLDQFEVDRVQRQIRQD
ncbi:MAG: TolC family protein, partial [Oculatellaceae cyanobacterium bins.114]|nr:TolC family protein [Oculatellaceae cyanobacterium bins.114]